MNKLLVVLLAVCLVTVSASVVKRETEATTPNSLSITKEIENFSKTINENLSKTFNPDNIKKSFNEGMDTISKFVSELTKQAEAKQ